MSDEQKKNEAEEPKAAEPKAAEPKAAEPKAAETKAEEPKAAETKAEEPKAAETKAAEAKPEEPKPTLESLASEGEEEKRVDPKELKAQKEAKKLAAQEKAGKLPTGKKKKDKKQKKGEEKFVRRTQPPRLKQKYQQEVVPTLMKEFSYTTTMAVPKLVKITLNMGLGQALQNAKLLESAEEELAVITGQKPVITKARKSIATYKLRQGQKIGAMVTLRHDRMYEFFDRLVTFALPRTRDFKGISPRSFDGRGNFSLGVKEQIIFPEIDYDKIEKIMGLNITIVTSARTDEEGRALLKHLGMPFR